MRLTVTAWYVALGLAVAACGGDENEGASDGGDGATQTTGGSTGGDGTGGEVGVPGGPVRMCLRECTTTTTMECGASWGCIDGYCRPVQCSEPDDPCAAPEQCVRIYGTNSCRTLCEGDGDCGGGSCTGEADDGTRFCSRDCASACAPQICNEDLGLCVCANNDNCSGTGADCVEAIRSSE